MVNHSFEAAISGLGLSAQSVKEQCKLSFTEDLIKPLSYEKIFQEIRCTRNNFDMPSNPRCYPARLETITSLVIRNNYRDYQEIPIPDAELFKVLRKNNRAEDKFWGMINYQEARNILTLCKAHAAIGGYGLVNPWGGGSNTFSKARAGAGYALVVGSGTGLLEVYLEQMGYFVDTVDIGATERTVVLDKRNQEYRFAHDMFLCFPKLVWGAEYTDFINYIQMKSEDFFQLSSNHNRRYDLIVIDGSHCEDVVREDISASIELLNYGGLLLIDDFKLPTQPGVVFAVLQHTDDMIFFHLNHFQDLGNQSSLVVGIKGFNF